LSPRWFLLLAALLLLYGLDYAPLWNPDEGRYASAALEMAQPFNGAAPDWIVPHLNTIPRINKPPLVYWLGAIFYRILGVSEASTRLVSALAAIVVMLTVWQLGHAMFSERAGIASALVWSTSVFPFIMAHSFNTDMLLCCAITLTFCGLWFVFEGTSKENDKAPWLSSYVLTGIGMGLALLSKGPVGIVLPLAITFVYACWAKRWNAVQWYGVGVAIALALLLALPWYWAVSLRVPNFLSTFLLQENLARFSGAKEFHRSKPVFYYVPILLAGLFPWTAFLGSAVARLRDQASISAQQRARLFLWLWSALLILFFSLSKVKLVSYILPAFPAVVLLAGDALMGGDALRENQAHQTFPHRMALAATALLYLLLMIGLPIAFLNEQLTLFGHLKKLPGNAIVPITEALPYIADICIVLAIGTLFLVWCWRTRNTWRLMLAQFATAAFLLVILLNLAGRIAIYEDASGLVKALQPHLKTGDQFIVYQGFQPASVFYLRQPVISIEYTQNSGLDEAAMVHSLVFLPADAKSLPQLLENPHRVYILLARKNDLGRTLQSPHYTVASCNDFLIISNYPAPPGLHYNFVAPRNRDL